MTNLLNTYSAGGKCDNCSKKEWPGLAIKLGTKTVRICVPCVFAACQMVTGWKLLNQLAYYARVSPIFQNAVTQAKSIGKAKAKKGK